MNILIVNRSKQNHLNKIELLKLEYTEKLNIYSKMQSSTYMNNTYMDMQCFEKTMYKYKTRIAELERLINKETILLEQLDIKLNNQ